MEQRKSYRLMSEKEGGYPVLKEGQRHQVAPTLCGKICVLALLLNLGEHLWWNLRGRSLPVADADADASSLDKYERSLPNAGVFPKLGQ